MSNKKSTGASAATPANSRREQLRQQQEAEAKRARTMRIAGIAAAILALALIAVVATVLINKNRTDVKAAAEQGTPVNALADKSGIRVNPGKAKEGAPVLQVYQDYQCPACKQVDEQIGPWVKSLADKGEVALEYRTMTFLDTNLRNDSSLKAGIAAACSDNVGAYEAYHNAVFAGQPAREGEGYTDAQLRDELAKTAGITGDKLGTFQACYDSKATEDFVKGTNEAAAKAGVTGTPEYRVNGKKLDLSTIGQSEQTMLEAIKKLAA